MMPDHYATLGVPPDAKTAAIRAAYLALMREYHPDRNPDPAATLRAQAVIAAFKVLGDFDRRSHYDWDRRREREAAEAEAAKRPRRTHATVIGAGAIGLAATGAFVMMPGPTSPPVDIEQTVAESRATPSAQLESPRPKRQATRASPSGPTKAPTNARKAGPSIDPATRTVEPRAPAQLAKAEPVGPAPPKPERVRAPAIRVATATPLTPPKQPPAARSPALPPIRTAAAPVRPAPNSTTDLASLDSFVMNFYGQSWRYGDAPKRAALEQSRASFVARRGGCTADTCKREAYLKLMSDVSAIVERRLPDPR